MTRFAVHILEEVIRTFDRGRRVAERYARKPLDIHLPDGTRRHIFVARGKHERRRIVVAVGVLALRKGNADPAAAARALRDVIQVKGQNKIGILMLRREVCVRIGVDEGDFVETGLHGAAADVPVFIVKVCNPVRILDRKIDRLACRVARNIRIHVQGHIVDFEGRIGTRGNECDASVDGVEVLQCCGISVVDIDIRRAVRFHTEGKYIRARQLLCKGVSAVPDGKNARSVSPGR